MQVKKSPEVNLEKKKSLFLGIGLVLALAICLFAFEWTTEEVSTSSLGDLSQVDLMEEEIDITQHEELPPPPPEPEPEQQEQIIEELVVVEDDVEVGDINIDTEADDRTKTSTQIVTTNFEVEEEVIEPVAFAVVEDKPTFPGGDAAIMKFITENVSYPAVAKELGIQGRVYVQFVVDVNGRVTQVQVMRGVDPHLDAEAMRVVKMMPPWSPGKQRGKPVPVTNVLPITFTLK